MYFLQWLYVWCRGLREDEGARNQATATALHERQAACVCRRWNLANDTKNATACQAVALLVFLHVIIHHHWENRWKPDGELARRTVSGFFRGVLNIYVKFSFCSPAPACGAHHL